MIVVITSFLGYPHTHPHTPPHTQGRHPPNLDITPMNSVDATPHLPPNYPPPEISPEDLGINSTGPIPVPVLNSTDFSPSKSTPPRDKSHSTSPNGTGSYNGFRDIRYSSTPRRDQRTPTAEFSVSGGNRTWRLDSFDDFEESLV